MTDDKFDQMMRQALSPQIPDDRLNNELIRKMEGEQMKKRNVFGSTIIIAVSVAVLGTCGFAANRVYRAFTEQTATYQYCVNIEPESEIINSNTPMKLVLNGVPEDLHYNEDGPYAGKYDTDNPDESRALTSNFMKVPEGGIHEPIEFATNSETWMTGSGNTVIYFEKDRGWDQVWIAFAGTEYAVQLYADGFSMEEIKALAEGAELAETDEEVACEWFDRYEAGDDGYVEQTRTLDHVISVGDTVKMPWFEDVEVTVNSLNVQDDFSGIATDSIGQVREYSKYLAEDGTIKSDWRVIELGDGAETLDEVIKEESVTCKLIVMNLTLNNTSATETVDICICPRIVMEEDGAVYDLPIEEDGFDIWTDDLYSPDGEMLSFSTVHAHSKNNIIDFLPGETTDVKVAFVLEEHQFENAYIQLMNGNAKEQVYIDLGEL